MLIDGWLGMLGFHRIVDEDDGIIVQFCTFRHFAKVRALF
jgi:hypothetical protein